MTMNIGQLADQKPPSPEISRVTAFKLMLAQRRLVGNAATLLVYAGGAEIAAKTHFLGLHASPAHSVLWTLVAVLGLRIALWEAGLRRRFDARITTRETLGALQGAVDALIAKLGTVDPPANGDGK